MATCPDCGQPVVSPDDYQPGVDRYSDTPGGHADRHTRVVENAHRIVQPCGPCRMSDCWNCASDECPCCGAVD